MNTTVPKQRLPNNDLQTITVFNCQFQNHSFDTYTACTLFVGSSSTPDAMDDAIRQKAVEFARKIVS